MLLNVAFSLISELVAALINRKTERENQITAFCYGNSGKVGIFNLTY